MQDRKIIIITRTMIIIQHLHLHTIIIHLHMITVSLRMTIALQLMTIMLNPHMTTTIIEKVIFYRKERETYHIRQFNTYYTGLNLRP